MVFYFNGLKRTFLFFGLFLMFSSCQEELQEAKEQFFSVTTFTTTHDTTVQLGEVSSSQLERTLELTPIALSVEQDPLYEENFTSLEKLKEVTVKQVEISLTNTNRAQQYADFSFLQEVTFYIQADGLEKIAIAKASDIVPTSTVLNLELEDEQVSYLSYFQSDNTEIVPVMVFKETVESPTDMYIKSRFVITPDLTQVF